jgi:hypothetical protein
MCNAIGHVRFTPESDIKRGIVKCPLWAKSGHSAMLQKLALFDHLIGAGQQ